MGSPLFLAHFLALILFPLFSTPSASQYVQERSVLYALKAMFNDPFLNQNWTGLQCFKNYPPYWYGIQCADGHVTGVLLENMGLSGEVRVDAFAKLPELTTLSLKNNSISGSIMDFSSNQKLKDINLAGNKLSGPIPGSLLSLNSLESLQLQDNKLTGPIPEFGQSSLLVFNVSNNSLSGPIPPKLQSLRADSISDNPELCGPPSSSACNSTADGSKMKSSGINFATMFILFDVVGLIAVMLLFYLYHKKVRKLKKLIKAKGLEDTDDETEAADQSNYESRDESKVHAVVEEKRVFVNEEKGNLIFMGDESAAGFELDDLLKASAEGLGKGIIGNSYKVMMPGMVPVVVKRPLDLKPLTREEFTRQLQSVCSQNHPNLLPILAYYHSKDEKFFVYKYAPNGNLFKLLHGGRGTKDRIPFRWRCRLSVARGVARALEYLHLNVNTDLGIAPHGNLKLSNVLLDENDMVLVSDYGLASLVALPIAAQRMVSFKSPEYQTAKKLSKKSDVWSYGCMLLELLTGRISVYTAPPGVNGVDLSSWVHRAVREEWTAEIFDMEISVRRSAAPGMLRLLQLAIQCCDKSPERRPEMTEVVREVESIKILNESEDEEDLSMDRSLTDESMSTSASGIINEEKTL